MEEEIKSVIENNKLVLLKDDLYIRAWHKETLRKYNLNVDTCVTLNDLLFLIDNLINISDDLKEDDLEELDKIAGELAEMNYYNNTNK